MRLVSWATLGAVLAGTSSLAAQPRPPVPSPPSPPQVNRPREAGPGDRVRRLEDELNATRRRLEQLEGELRRAKEEPQRPESPSRPENRQPNDDRGRSDRGGDRRPEGVNRPIPPMGPPGFGRMGPGGPPPFPWGGSPSGFMPRPPISNSAAVEERLERIEKVLVGIREVLLDISHRNVR